jgi:hypothetical protein
MEVEVEPRLKETILTREIILITKTIIQSISSRSEISICVFKSVSMKHNPRSTNEDAKLHPVFNPLEIII